MPDKRKEKSRSPGGLTPGLITVLVAGTLVFAAALLVIEHQNSRKAERAALEQVANAYSTAILTFRDFYAQIILKKLQGSDIEITHDYVRKDKALPIPATLSLDLIQFLNSRAIKANMRLVSAYPFPWRQGRELTEFDRAAFDRLNSTADSSYSDLFERGDQNVFEYAVPVRMGETCVACHNDHPDSPKRDWKIGDIRGIQVVTLRPDSVGTQTQEQRAYFIVAVLFFFAFTLLVISWLINRNRLANRLLLREKKQLALARDAAEAASRAKSHFLANMSHEIRTPMNAVIGLSHLALETRLDERQRGYLEKIQSSAKNLLGIINDILDFSKIEAGRMSVNREGFRLGELLDQVTAVVSPSATEKGLELLISEPSRLPAHLIGDAMRLSQVLTNLASNAVKFTERGQVVLRIEPLSREGDRLLVRFSVQDTGIGLSEAQIGRLFESFSQADDSTTRKYGGTGLGLAISKRLVELMGGSIGLESTPGQGSTFHFTVPLEIAPDSALEGEPDVQDLQGRRVLIVDDHAAAREILREMAQSFGMQVDEVDSGEAGLEALRRCDAGSPYDFVLLDLRMAGMDGLATEAAIRHDPGIVNKPAVVLVTAYGQDATLAEASARHLVTLQKPVSPSTLLDGMLDAIGLHRARPRLAAAPVRDVQAIQGILGAHVLLAEDNAINRQVAGELLERLGLVVSYANNGKEAIQAVASQPFDLVLMDVQMPELDGYEASRHIRGSGQHAELPIIALTAHAMSGDRERCLDAGMDDYLTKPIDPEALFVMVTKWIRPDHRGTQTATTPAQDASASPRLPAKLPGIDMPRALANLDHDQALYLDILQRFLADYQGLPRQLRDAVRDDTDEALRLCHTLKGVAGAIGATALADHAAMLEQGLRRQHGGDEAGLDGLLRELTHVLDGLQAVQPQPGQTDGPGSAIVSDGAVSALLGELSRLIAAGDLQALEPAARLAKLFAQGPLAARAQELNQCLNNFDFDKAQTILQDLIAQCADPH